MTPHHGRHSAGTRHPRTAVPAEPYALQVTPYSLYLLMVHGNNNKGYGHVQYTKLSCAARSRTLTIFFHQQGMPLWTSEKNLFIILHSSY